MPTNKGQKKRAAKGASLRTCRHREMRGRFYLGNQPIGAVHVLVLLPTGPRCESSGVGCSVASWNESCSSRFRWRFVGDCAWVPSCGRHQGDCGRVCDGSVP